MLCLAAASALVPSVIAAVASVSSAGIIAWVAFRAQGNSQQLVSIEKMLREFSDRVVEQIEEHIDEVLDAKTRALVIGDIVRRVMHEMLGDPQGRRRRWYE